MIHTLTSFRFFAAFLVFLLHVNLVPEYMGESGVSFFFILSGFIMTVSYYSTLVVGAIDYFKIIPFYKARLARIFPVHVLTLLLAVPYWIHVGQMELQSNQDASFPLLAFLILTFTHLLLLQSYFPYEAVYFSLNGVAWSLSVEMLFYLCFPYISRLLHKLKACVRTIRFLLGTITVWGAFTVLVWLLRECQSNYWLFYIFPFTRMIDFTIGICIGLVFIQADRKKGLKSAPAFETELFTILEIFGLALLSAAFYFAPHVHKTLLYGAYFIPVWSILIFIFAFQRGLIAKILTSRILIKLGEISFSFYMVHKLVILYLDMIRTAYSLRLPQQLYSSLALLIAVALSCLIFTYYEEPLRKRIRLLTSTAAVKGALLKAD